MTVFLAGRMLTEVLTMRKANLLAACAGATLAACGGSHPMTVIEERPLDQAVALDTIEEALAARNVSAERFVRVILPNQREWTLDIAATTLPLAIEFLTEQDREQIGDAVPIQATPDETPRVVSVRRVGVEGDAGKLYLRVFTDQHFRYQPNPPPDLPHAPYTIREVRARLRRDVIDFVAWYVANHGTGGNP